MDFASLLRQSWSRFIDGIVNLVLFTLVGLLLSLTIVLIPSVVAGWIRGTLGWVREDRAPAFEELWSFDGYLQVLLFLLLGGLLIGIGYALLIVPGVILNVLWLYAIFFIVDRDMDFSEAMRASKEVVTRTGFFDHLVVFLIVCVLSTLGGAVTVLGALFTTPFVLILVALVYLETAEAADAGAEPITP